MLRDAHFMSIADRSILACWGVKGGKAGRSFQVTIDPGGPGEREVDALADAEPVRAGEVDPDPHDRRRRLGRPAGRAPWPTSCGTCEWGKVSVDGRARRLRRRARPYDGDDRRPSTARPPTRCGPSCASGVRASEPFFDRGPGYARLSGGKAFADVDVL